MSTSQGTTPTGTEVQNVDTAHTALLYAEDSKLIGAVVSAVSTANKSAERFQSDMGKLAGAILDLHQAGTWSRTIDGETGKLYTSARAFYASLFDRTDKDGNRLFQPLHKVLRDELVAVLFDGEKLAGIGTNELAELIGCNPAQISRSVAQAKQQAAIENAPVVPTDAELDAIAEEAKRVALESGADDKAAAYAAEQARAKAKAEAGQATPEESPEDKAKREKAEAEAEAKRVEKIGKTFVNATAAANDHFHLMTPERRAEVLKVATELVSAINAFEVVEAAKANGPTPRAPRAPRRSA